jgi:uncharacterized SAM-binding protein YcdF (DUF218 family)
MPAQKLGYIDGIFSLPEQIMKRVFSLLCCFALMPVAHAQSSSGLTNLLRSVTSAISGEAKPPATSSSEQATPVLGVRGMDEDTAVAKNTMADPAQVFKLLDGWAVGHAEAEKAAAKRGLAAHKVVYAEAGKGAK